MPHQPDFPAGSDSDALRRGVAAWVAWYVQMGVVDGVEAGGVDRYRYVQDAVSAPRLPAARSDVAEPPPAAPARGTPSRTIVARESDRRAHAREVAAACRSLDELHAALERFDGCALKETATRLCFADGSPQASLMLIGEAPGAEEDRLGRPFVGPSGQLLDRMLAAIGLGRTDVWITNIIFWRPPGNRTPTTTEVAICQPFLERQIELIQPRLILFLGGTAAKALLDVSDGVTKLRGRRFTYRGSRPEPTPAFVTFHPAYLLRQPLQKRFAWRDLLTVQAELEAIEARSPVRHDG